ncbi:hypothetical protein DSO57_1012101 [Entomophthora muscae]|nr:hypothetical protein DSO57_1012101 [Entomophthora muscae]
MEPLPFLEYPNVTINNPKAVLEKITKINKDGAEALHIITDFDMTLTKHWVNGKRNFSSHSALQASNAVSDDFVKQAKEIFAKYYPLEIDPTIPHNEKVKHMVDFWEESHGIFIKEKLSADLIRAALKDFKIVYREGTHHFMDVTGKKNIPVLVFSAGVGDIINELLIGQGLLHPHVYVISNFMDFRASPPHEAIGFKKPLIHLLNKGEIALKETPFYGLAHSRQNAILMGDSLGDLQMSNGLDHSTLLTIGFLSHNVDQNLTSYSSQFDVVITHDSSFDWVNQIINHL